MFRVKVRLVAGILVVLLNVAVYLAITIPLSRKAEERVERNVERASKLVVRSQKLHALELQNMVLTVAAQPEFKDWMDKVEERERRAAAFDAITEYDDQLKKEERKAHFFAIVGKDGAVLARDLDINNMYGEKLPFANIQTALKGTPTIEIWDWRNRLMRSAAAPLMHNGEVIGAVVIAYDITAAEARLDRDQFTAEVAYFLDRSIRASSFSLANDDSKEDAGKVQQLTRSMLQQASAVTKALDQGRTSELTEVALGDEIFLAKAGILPIGQAGKKSAYGFVVACSLTRAQDPVNSVRWMLLILSIGSVLLVFGVILAVTRHFVNAEDTLELGVTEVINGNLEYTFESSEEFEGLANALNVMLSRLLGRPEPGEDMEEAEASRDDGYVIILAEVDDADLNSSLAQELANESEEDYRARLFREYVEARSQQGLPVDDLTSEGLMLRLRANENLLRARYKCQMVRFVVVSQSGLVSFKPIRIG